MDDRMMHFGLSPWSRLVFWRRTLSPLGFFCVWLLLLIIFLLFNQSYSFTELKRSLGFSFLLRLAQKKSCPVEFCQTKHLIGVRVSHVLSRVVCRFTDYHRTRNRTMHSKENYALSSVAPVHLFSCLLNMLLFNHPCLIRVLNILLNTTIFLFNFILTVTVLHLQLYCTAYKL